MIKIKIKKLYKDTKMPSRAHKGDAGFDCYIHSFHKIDEIDEKTEEMKFEHIFFERSARILCRLGFSAEIPEGYYAQVLPKSGLAIWKGITIINSPGTIDSGYRNEWGAILINTSYLTSYVLRKGDKICQFIIRKLVDCELDEVEFLNDSERGLGEFGSTGEK